MNTHKYPQKISEQAISLTRKFHILKETEHRTKTSFNKTAPSQCTLETKKPLESQSSTLIKCIFNKTWNEKCLALAKTIWKFSKWLRLVFLCVCIQNNVTKSGLLYRVDYHWYHQETDVNAHLYMFGCINSISAWRTKPEPKEFKWKFRKWHFPVLHSISMTSCEGQYLVWDVKTVLWFNEKQADVTRCRVVSIIHFLFWPDN